MKATSADTDTVSPRHHKHDILMITEDDQSQDDLQGDQDHDDHHDDPHDQWSSRSLAGQTSSGSRSSPECPLLFRWIPWKGKYE